MMLRNYRSIIDFPSFDSKLEVDERGQKWGRKDRRIELVEVCGRGMEEIRGETMNIEVK